MTISIDIQPRRGLPEVPFGSAPKSVTDLFGTDLTWEPWMGGNLNDSLYYPGIVFSYDSSDSQAPLPNSRLHSIEVSGSIAGTLLGRQVGAWTKKSLADLLAAGGISLRTAPNDSIHSDGLSLSVWFEPSGAISLLRIDAPAEKPNETGVSKWEWFKQHWSLINVVYAVVLVAAFWIVNGSPSGKASGPCLVLTGILFLSLGLDGIRAGDFGDSIFGADRNKNFWKFWVLIAMTMFLGCTFVFVGMGSLWGRR
jgi:hypothetical protein